MILGLKAPRHFEIPRRRRQKSQNDVFERRGLGRPRCARVSTALTGACTRQIFRPTDTLFRSSAPRSFGSSSLAKGRHAPPVEWSARTHDFCLNAIWRGTDEIDAVYPRDDHGAEALR